MNNRYSPYPGAVTFIGEILTVVVVIAHPRFRYTEAVSAFELIDGTVNSKR